MNVLTDGLFLADRQALTLPEVLAKLSVDDILSFDELRPHQQHGLYAFLVQLAAMALHRAGSKNIPGRMETWFELLSEMTKWQEEPWSLVVGDLTKPAFFQPPVFEKSLECYTEEGCPDTLDNVMSGIGVDIKHSIMPRPTPGHWMMLLINLQTMSNNLGTGNYGAARMYGGNGCRPCVTFVPPEGQFGPRFRRDVSILLKRRAMIAREYGYKKKGGIELMWTLPWDGEKESSLELSQLDPYVIDNCRKVRLTLDGDQIIAARKTTKGMRVNANELRGIVGDPWSPVEVEAEKSFTPTKVGLPYTLLADLLLSKKFKPAITQEIQTTDGKELVFYAWAMPTGQGKPAGYHERAIPIPGYGCKLLMSEDEKDRLFATSLQRIKAVSDMVSQVLKYALCALIQKGPDRLNLKDKKPYAYMQQFDTAVDQEFFPRLWEGLLVEEKVAHKNWVLWLKEEAYECLQRAKTSVPYASAARYRAVAAAEGFFHGMFKKTFPEVLEKEKESEYEEKVAQAL